MALKYAAPYPRVIAEITLDPANVPAGTITEETLTVPNVTTDMQVIVTAPSLETNLLISTIGATAADTVKFRLFNPTGGGINPASQTFKVIGF